MGRRIRKNTRLQLGTASNGCYPRRCGKHVQILLKTGGVDPDGTTGGGTSYHLGPTSRHRRPDICRRLQIRPQRGNQAYQWHTKVATYGPHETCGDLWSTFDAQETNCHKHSVFDWQKTHVGEVENEHADQLAGAAYDDDVAKTIELRTKHGGIIARAKKYVQLMAEILQRDAQAVKDDEVHFDEYGPPNGG